MPNKWITHVKKYHSDHPNLNYKQVMQQAKETYKKTQKGKGGGVSKPSATLNPMPPTRAEPTLEQLQTESRQWARHHNNHVEAMGDQIQNRRNKLLTQIAQDKRLPQEIHDKIDSFLNY